MKPLRQAIADYIALRRSLGFKLRGMAGDLENFALFLEQRTAPYVTTGLAMEWAMQPANHQPSDWAKRLSYVRVFARHWQATDPRTEVPPEGLLPFRPQRARPYLYSELEIQELLAAAMKLAPSQGLRPWTYHCLLGLLAVAGLRIGEALKLERPVPAQRIVSLFLSQRSRPPPGWFRGAPNVLRLVAADRSARTGGAQGPAPSRFPAPICRPHFGSMVPVQ